MDLFIALLGATMVGVGIFWRLREIEAQARAGSSRGRARLGRGAQPRRPSAPKPLPRETKAAGAKGAEAEAPHENVPSAKAQGFRRSDRVLLKIPLEVSGTDSQGNFFTERTHTLVINRNGACFVLRASLGLEDQMMVKNLQTGQSCRFRACEISQDLPNGLREWGVECVDPAPGFWRISFPEAALEPSAEEETVKTALECTVCHFREMAELAVSEYRAIVGKTSSARYCNWCGETTDWNFAAIQDIEEPGSPGLETKAPAVLPPAGVEKRGEPRRIVRLPISIRHEDGREEFTMTENVSRSGVCFAANMELAVGDRVFLTLESEEGSGEAETRAQTMWRRKISEKRGNLYGMKLERDEPPAA